MGAQETDSFESAWKAVQASVLRWCRRATDDAQDADELYQRVMVRAWRGHATFRGDAAYLTWVIRIATREAARLHAHRSLRRRRETDLDERVAAVTAAHEDDAGPDLGWMAEAVAHAAATGSVTTTEAAVLRLRLAEPKAPWEELGGRLGLTAQACAVAHCRAVPKLRTHLFLHHQEELGGRDAVAGAYRAACTAPARPLTGPPADAFRIVVLDRRTDYRRRGWLADLRTACGLVVRQLAVPGPG